MIWLDTKEEVDFDWFMEVLRNNELQVVSRKWTEEEKEELSRQIAEYKAHAVGNSLADTPTTPTTSKRSMSQATAW